jgi:hypothetical protein
MLALIYSLDFVDFRVKFLCDANSPSTTSTIGSLQGSLATARLLPRHKLAEPASGG